MYAIRSYYASRLLSSASGSPGSSAIRLQARHVDHRKFRLVDGQLAQVLLLDKHVAGEQIVV